MMILGRIKKGNNWTKPVMILSLLCSVFSFNVNAQTNSDKPLNAPQLANLKTGLKQALQENLAFAETDGEKYTAITQKWDARNDLAGKSKTQAIDLLYQDVKTIVTDSGMQYQISQVFSLYKQMPDDQFSDQTKSTMGSDSKPEAVEQLTNLTFPEHPYVGIEQELAKLPGTKDIEAGKAEDRKNRIECFDAALKVNKKLTADQKSFVKANYKKLREIVVSEISDTLSEMFPTKEWTHEFLEQKFSQKLTEQEITELIAYFQEPGGRTVLKVLKNAPQSGEVIKNGGASLNTKAEEAELGIFAATTTGGNFIDAYLDGIQEYFDPKFAEAGPSGKSKVEAIVAPANINKVSTGSLKTTIKNKAGNKLSA